MYTVNEVSKRTGVSVRTLHHYDRIGLLKPSQLTVAGYRLYDDTALRRLHSILMFREIGFSLKEIRDILDAPDFDYDEALKRQIKLLELQQKRIGELISFACEIREKGVNNMNFDIFKSDEIDSYKAEVKEKWGSTKAYEEYEARTSDKSPAELEDTARKLMEIFADIGTVKHLAPDSKEAREKISGLQKFITDNYYTCTDEILCGLGQMYVGDKRMKRNIDKAVGDGTAEFAAKAVSAYCSGKNSV
ncbi:MAG: MerR family transcriptional regulator [Oscillospiraceae bacterium]|nr:MerR family transcriptional regulator [Oscillospiraceae bacterium]